MSEKVYVYCDTCKKPVPSFVSVKNQEVLRTAAFRNNVTECPNCGKNILWSKAELWPKALYRRNSHKKGCPPTPRQHRAKGRAPEALRLPASGCRVEDSSWGRTP